MKLALRTRLYGLIIQKTAKMFSAVKTSTYVSNLINLSRVDARANVFTLSFDRDVLRA
jgi:hypothetical protein